MQLWLKEARGGGGGMGCSGVGWLGKWVSVLCDFSGPAQGCVLG